MIEIKTKLRRWGNSLGIVVPLNKIEREDLGEGDEVTALIVGRKKIDLRKLFGAHKFSKPTNQLMREIDSKLYDD